MVGMVTERERVLLRLTAAGLPAQSRHADSMVRAVVTRLGGSVRGKLPEEIDAAVALVKGRVPAVFDPDQPADPGAAGFREFAARFPGAAKLSAEQEAALEVSDAADEQVRALLADLGVRS